MPGCERSRMENSGFLWRARGLHRGLRGFERSRRGNFKRFSPGPGGNPRYVTGFREVEEGENALS